MTMNQTVTYAAGPLSGRSEAALPGLPAATGKHHGAGEARPAAVYAPRHRISPDAPDADELVTYTFTQHPGW
jgi:hypothetical protein